MNPISLHKTPNPDCAELTNMAEKELAAFFSAITALFGSEKAGYAADAWLRELDAVNNVPASARDWRSITVKVATQLANRLNPATKRQQAVRRNNICVFSSQVPQAS